MSLKKFRVYHIDEFGKRDAEFPEDFSLVAIIAAEDLEGVWKATNSIESPWTENIECYDVFGGSHRSTSVGDVVVDEEGTTFLCDIVGWKEIGVGFKTEV